jgi:hypothetical protein
MPDPVPLHSAMPSWLSSSRACRHFQVPVSKHKGTGMQAWCVQARTHPASHFTAITDVSGRHGHSPLPLGRRTSEAVRNGWHPPVTQKHALPLP